MKRIILLVLCISIMMSISGCSETEVLNSETPEKETGIYGSWIVEKTEIYDGPMKSFLTENFDRYYYKGAEYLFTENNEIKAVFNESLTTTFKIINDTEMEIVSVNEGKPTRQDYELNGDSLITYGYYEDDFSEHGRSCAIYYKRKGTIEVADTDKLNTQLQGVWVIDKYQVYDGPIKNECEAMCKSWYYAGAEYEFTADNTFKAVFDESLTTTYNILNENKIEMLTLAGESLIYDYELNGNSLIIHSNYTGDLAGSGYCLSLYLSKK